MGSHDLMTATEHVFFCPDIRRIPCRGGGVDGVNIEIISPERAKGVEMQCAVEKHSQIPHNKTEQFIYPKSLNSLRPPAAHWYTFELSSKTVSPFLSLISQFDSHPLT